MLWNWLAAAVRASVAPARATRSWRSASTGRSPALGVAVASPARTAACRRLGIDRVGRAATSPGVTVRLVDLDHAGPPGTQMPGQSRTPRARGFDPDRPHLPQAGDPAGQVPVAARRGYQRCHVPPAGPPPSPTTAAWTSLWVSTPATTRRSSPSAMVDMPPLLLTWMGWHARPGRWTRQGAGLIAQAPLRSRSPDRSCLGQRPTHSADRSDHRHQSDLADLRVRPSERNPARFLVS